jgi:hypothetical protein
MVVIYLIDNTFSLQRLWLMSSLPPSTTLPARLLHPAHSILALYQYPIRAGYSFVSGTIEISGGVAILWGPQHQPWSCQGQFTFLEDSRSIDSVPYFCYAYSE